MKTEGVKSKGVKEVKQVIPLSHQRREGTIDPLSLVGEGDEWTTIITA